MKQISLALLLLGIISGCSDEEQVLLPPTNDLGQRTNDAWNIGNGLNTNPSNAQTDVTIEKKVFGEPCTHASECASSICMEGLDGGLCSESCVDGCADGWECKNVSLPTPNLDVNFACVPSFAFLCRPCGTDADCRNPYVIGASEACIHSGPGGSFCGVDCSVSECPEGYECLISNLADGGQAPQCLREGGGECTCRSSWASMGLLTECTSENAIGSCPGLRTCAQGGLTPCDAPTPDLEVCNNKDDDCNGLTDEGACGGTAPEPEEPTGPAMNSDWIGGACKTEANCEYQGGYCFDEASGFPDGMCSKDCDLYCPDEDGKTTTFCIDETALGLPSDGGVCAMQCNFEASESGCRTGYQCINLPRHNDPSTTKPTCIPESVILGSSSLEGINEGWIGGECEGDFQCAYDDGICLPESQGFVKGMCSQDCALYCPDSEGMTMTFCIDPIAVDLDQDGGLCAMRCNYELSATGCRLGYKCVDLPRHNDPFTISPTCIPISASGTLSEQSSPTMPTTDCQQDLSDLGIYFTIATNPMDSPKDHPELVCDIKDPIYVEGTILGVNFRYDSMNNAAKPIFASCPLALAMAKTAKMLSENDITDVLHLGVYNCRTIGGTNKLSQHALANALDIRALRHSNGQTYTVFDDWEKDTAFPITTSGAFLKWFAETLYLDWVFNIILTPDHNKAHEDHFHLDLTDGSHFLD